jgi:hypothetical protein
MGFVTIKAHRVFSGFAVRGHETCKLEYKHTSTFDGMVVLHCPDHEMDCHVMPKRTVKRFEYDGLDTFEHIIDTEMERRAKVDKETVITDKASAEEYMEDVLSRKAEADDFEAREAQADYDDKNPPMHQSI